jgi:hypothetical protein
LSSPLWRGEIKWGIVLFCPDKTQTRNHVKRPKRPVVKLFGRNLTEFVGVGRASALRREAS